MSYKDSGIKSIRKIPTKWNVERLKDILTFQSGYAFPSYSYKDTGVQLILIGNLYQNKLSLGRNPTFVAEEYLESHKDFIVSKDDILISLTGTLGKRDYGFCIKLDGDQKYLLNQRVGCIRIKRRNISVNWLIYLLQSESFYCELLTLPKGTKQGNLSEFHLLSMETVMPKSAEQAAIANYLDTKTQSIEKKIGLLEKKIGYYQELRKSLINEAVTKGLEKNVDLDKNELGFITPKKWFKYRLKDLGFLYSGLSGKSGDDFNQDENTYNKGFIPFTNIANNTYLKHDHLGTVVVYEGEKQNKVRKGDIFFLMSSEGYEDIGKTAALTEDIDETYLNSFCKGYRVNPRKCNPFFLNYLMLSDYYRQLLIVEGKGFTRINLKMEKVNDFLVYIPNTTKAQEEIVKFLDGKLDTIAKIITNIQSQIITLKELRKTLINDVVTGKIKIIND